MQNVDDVNTNSSYDSPVPSAEDALTSPQNSGRHSFLSLALTVVAILGIAFGIRFFVATPYLVEGASMEGTFYTYDYLIVDRVSYRITAPQRGDVIVMQFPLDESRTFIKRVIGLPGETVEMRGTAVTIKNDEYPEGITLNEPYVEPIHQTETELSITLKDGEYFVLGDNRKESADSRYWGVLPASDIIGRPFIRVYPFDQLSIFPGEARYGDPTDSSSSGL